MKEEFEYSISKIDDAAEWLLDIIDSTSSKIVAFDGSMGAGKTTLISEMCRIKEVEDVPSSPTFAIVNVYKTRGGEYINHFDFYRTQKVEEAYDIGFDEYLESGQLCFIEWPGIVSDFLPDETLKVSIMVIKEITRKLVVETIN